VAGQGLGEGHGGGDDAAFGQLLSQAVHGAFHPHACGVFLQAQGGADFGEGPVLEEAEDHRFAVGLVQAGQGIVEQGS
jgi:hypothetical protein